MGTLGLEWKKNARRLKAVDGYIIWDITINLMPLLLIIIIITITIMCQ